MPQNRDKSTKEDKPPENDKKRIIEMINRMSAFRGREYNEWIVSGSSYCDFISQKTGISERTVAGYVATFTRAFRKSPGYSRNLQKAIQGVLRRDPPPEGYTRAEWCHKLIGIPERQAAGLIAVLSKTENRLLAIDGTFESRERKSEAKHLKELFRIYDWSGAVKLNPVRATSNQKFHETLENATEKYIHISAHGAHEKDVGTTLFPSMYSRYKLADVDDIEKLWSKRGSNEKPRLVVMAACESGHEDMAKALFKAGVKFFIAPTHEPSWIEVALFNTFFYYHLFARSETVEKAYKMTMRKFPEFKRWSFYIGGKKAD